MFSSLQSGSHWPHVAISLMEIKHSVRFSSSVPPAAFQQPSHPLWGVAATLDRAVTGRFHPSSRCSRNFSEFTLRSELLNIYYFTLCLIFIPLNRRQIWNGRQLHGEWIFLIQIIIIIIDPIYLILSILCVNETLEDQRN